MYSDLKKRALKSLAKNKKILCGLVFFYLILIMLLNGNFRGGLIIHLLIYILIFGFNIAGYYIILKLAEGRWVSADDFLNVISDRDYWNVFKNEWLFLCHIYIPVFLFTIILDFYKMLFWEYGLFKLIELNTFNIVCLCIALISLIFFVKWTVKYLFIPYILTDRYNGNASPDTEANKDTYFYNKQLIGENRADILKFVISFSGWFILACLTSGLGFALLLPYFRESSALLYVKRRDEYQEAFLKNRL